MIRNIELSVIVNGKEEIFGEGLINENGGIELGKRIGKAKDFPALMTSPLNLTTIYQVMRKEIDDIDNYKKPRIKINIY